MSLQRMVVMEQERRDQPRIAFLKKTKTNPQNLPELVRDEEGREEGKVMPWFLPFCQFFTW